MSKININAYGEIENDPDLSYEILYDPTSNTTFKKKRDSWKTKTIIISSAQLRTLGSTPIELLPQPGVGKYYDWELDFIYIFVTTQYGMAQQMTLTQGTLVATPIGRILDSVQTVIQTIRPGWHGNATQNGYPFIPNSKLLLTTVSSVNPTNGLGYVKIKLKYKIKNI